eukprot:366480-Chlamydomonas_euryale.AAC.8
MPPTRFGAASSAARSSGITSHASVRDLTPQGVGCGTQMWAERRGNRNTGACQEFWQHVRHPLASCRFRQQRFRQQRMLRINHGMRHGSPESRCAWQVWASPEWSRASPTQSRLACDTLGAVRRRALARRRRITSLGLGSGRGTDCRLHSRGQNFSPPPPRLSQTSRQIFRSGQFPYLSPLVYAGLGGLPDDRSRHSRPPAAAHCDRLAAGISTDCSAVTGRCFVSFQQLCVRHSGRRAHHGEGGTRVVPARGRNDIGIGNCK